ncbi:SAC3/GANP/Nin1/mts3/eIF-3 p25 [Macleaya cordata]|uniref:SAC3/GANP/Nin1/mts3/eIF-3 p25 n=1 Tax=Macleaya cordata TaxID=56857 RepID=A0A200QTQ4_MACCD|nr:SAC3/GANP/Nin1/mts3/eIF-3 p25 [Macleaya cordata]
MLGMIRHVFGNLLACSIKTISTIHSHPSDVRPLQVLEDTLTYLLNLLDSSEHPFEVLHDFIFDRTRAIRQDLSMQNIVNDRAIHMYEEMVKFHITSHYKLSRCSSNANISSLHHLNMEQLTKSLLSLYELYNANRKSNSSNANEAHFRSFYVLLHLDSNSQSTGESLSLWFRHLAAPVIKSKEMCFARRVLRFFRIGNYKHFLNTAAAEASYLQYYLIEHSINEVRIQAVSCINYGGYKLLPYPLEDLSKLLMMKESDVESLCNSCGLETSTDEAGNKFLPTKQTGFCRPKAGLQNYSFLGLERLHRQVAVENS